jgi:alpha-ribazole phosphatase/probable phosphoglycerate mutase
MPEPAAGDTVIELLRHGEPVGGSRFRGQRDDPLSERGWQQMWAAVDGRTPWQQVLSSPLLRCHAFAEALCARHGLPLRAEPRFAEIGFGVWEGRTRQELEAQEPGQVERFLRDPVGQRPPGAEPLDAFVARVRAGFDELLACHAGQTVLVVAHAGVIRTILATVLDMPPAAMYRIHVAHAGITRLHTDHGRTFRLIAHGTA